MTQRLVICCDGTWQRPDQTWLGKRAPSNVARMARLIAARAGTTAQAVWYDEGVGTGGLVDRIAGGLFGTGLDHNIVEAHRFLSKHFSVGDEIFLFGFSRGAYTVRSLAGMIRKCGITRPELEASSHAIDLYRDEHHPDAEGPRRFRAETSVAGEASIPIRFIGVWDTVGALGIPLSPLSALTRARYQFHDTELSGTVAHAYHALAIDERRRPFEPTLWTSGPKNDQTLEQIWFSGSHSDVGGGIGSRGLPEIALQWMIDKAEAAGLGFDPDAMSADSLVGDPLARMNRIERSRLWSLVSADRPMGWREGAPDPTQGLHPAVHGRWSGIRSYRPANLSAYLARFGDA